ncbi:MAG: SH3 domain-containing protein [Burkholderiaceae bacterium]|nr:SH3 domain-containing protein [Burkholderiaceae bacterium]
MPSGQIKSWMRNAALAAAIAMPLAAVAQQAIVSAGGNLRAGPYRNYPLVAQLAPGTPATVMGCINGYAWCDVVVPGGLRGWLYSGRLAYAYQGGPVPLLSIGAAIGVPIVAFSIDTYWNNYYRDRPWYGQPRWWGGRRPLPPAPGWRPPPPGVPAWKPHVPPAQWRPPAGRPGMARPAMRPQQMPNRHVPNQRPPERRGQDQRR